MRAGPAAGGGENPLFILDVYFVIDFILLEAAPRGANNCLYGNPPSLVYR